MRARTTLLVLAATAMIGCGESASPFVTITDVHVNREPDGALRSGTFTLHVAQPADAPGSGAIELHSLDLTVGAATFVVTDLVGDPPGDVAPGEEVTSPMAFLLHIANFTDDAINACAEPGPSSLGGIYFDETQSAFFPLRAAPAWLASPPLAGATWSEVLGDAGLDLEHDVAAFADGSSVMVGSASGSLDFSGKMRAMPGKTAPFLVKLDPQGKPLWSRYFATSFIDPQLPVQGVRFVATTPSGGVVVAGHLDGTLDLGGGKITSAGNTDVFLARFDGAGNHLETRRFGDGFTQTVAAMDVDAAGNTILVGTLFGATDFGAGPITPILDPSYTSYYVARLPESGPPIYARIPVAISSPSNFAAAASPDGAVVVGGSFTGSAWLGADPIQTAPSSTGYLVKLGADGKLAWSGTSPGGSVLAVAIDQGDVVAAMRLTPSAIVNGQPVDSGLSGALALARFDPAGALRYTIPLGFPESADVTGLIIDSAGHTLLSGHELLPGALTILATGPAAPASFFVETDRSGVVVRTQSFGCDTWPIDLAVAHQGSRDITLVSTFAGAVDLGKGPVPGAGQTDFLMARLPAL